MTTPRKGYTTGAEADSQLNATQFERDYWQEQSLILRAPDADNEAATEKFAVHLGQQHRWWYLFLASEQ